MTFVPNQQAATGATKIFRIVLVCMIAFALAGILWRMVALLDIARNYQFIADAVVGVLLLLSLGVARSSWRGAGGSPSPRNSRGEPLG